MTRSHGCWIHRGSLGSHGYPQYGGAKSPGGGLAHRTSWIIANGPIPVGSFILHRCNIKRCVNPEHLYAGSHIDNMNDVSKSMSHPNRRLTAEQVRYIRASDASLLAIAKDFGVSQRCVWQVRNFITYRHDV